MNEKIKDIIKNSHIGLIFGTFAVIITIMLGILLVRSIFFNTDTTQTTVYKKEPYKLAANEIAKYLSENLHDYSSLEIISTEARGDSNEVRIVECKYRAKNMFGAYVLNDQIFIFDAAGKISSVIDANELQRNLR